MNLPYFLARKVAFSNQRSFSKLIINIAVVAVALSMTVMVVASALISGFKYEITSKIFGFWGHINIESFESNGAFDSQPVSLDQPFYPEYDSVARFSYQTYEDYRYGDEASYAPEIVTSEKGVRHIQSYIVKAGIIKTEREFEGIILKGVDTDFDWDFIEKSLRAGTIFDPADSSSLDQLLVSQTTADRLSLQVGDRLIIHFVKNDQQFRSRFTVAGIYKTGLEEYDERFAIAHLRKLQAIYGWDDDQVSGFEVFVDDLDDLDVIGRAINDDLPLGLYSRTIRQSNPNIFGWLDLQDTNRQVILLLMLVVSIINMVTALIILILDRTNMIGTLKALGQTNWGVQRVFLYYAAYITGLGLLIGNALALLLCWLQDTFELITLKEEDYYVAVAPIKIEWMTILGLNLVTLAVVMVVLLVPSLVVWRITPVRAMRFK